MKDRVNRLLLEFPELPDIKADHATFNNLVFDRKTNHYREAIEIAAMLLLNYRPDIVGGRNHVLAILFDMNKLWEEYIYRQLRKALPMNWEMVYQNGNKLWELCDSSRERRVRPDIVLRDENEDAIIIDTKWKMPEDDIPDDCDPKQMFVYNEYWGAKHSVLLYPRSKNIHTPEYFKGRFVDKPLGRSAHNCGIMKVSVLGRNDDQLNRKVGKEIFEVFFSKAFK
jgi:5-methylcytosine-specific restriction enzyme subunit McrC